MPELPEVQTIVNQLNRTIAGKEIKAVDVLFAKPIKGVSAEEFKRKIAGEKIKKFFRRAKLVVAELSGGFNLLFHLKLTGRLLLLKENEPTTKHTHIIFHLSGGEKLVFEDFRKFGYVKFVKSDELEELFRKEKYGPEPFSKNFTLDKFKELLGKKPNAKIKPLLMDQTFIAGVGNIYAQESCFCARILPMRKVGTLTDKEISDLYHCLLKILEAAIQKKGSSVDAYLTIYGKEGEYVPLLKVYGRGGEKCLRCGATLKEIRLGGRGTVYCPKCQK
jgi:formamidopyrimidine-DNA glycosylase